MNRYTALLLASFILGGLLGMVAGLYLAANWIEEEYRQQEAKKIGSTMRHNQMCVEKWKRTEQCVDWR